ncbi:MAG: hypothetical protein F6K19_33595 [Cyanothece sp. SIO1E1]|nr:hypothetical protein [Cyanothece sp. SIO1E1]
MTSSLKAQGEGPPSASSSSVIPRRQQESPLKATPDPATESTLKVTPDIFKESSLIAKLVNPIPGQLTARNTRSLINVRQGYSTDAVFSPTPDFPL